MTPRHWSEESIKPKARHGTVRKETVAFRYGRLVRWTRSQEQAGYHSLVTG